MRRIGFTLVELLIVLLILGLVATGVIRARLSAVAGQHLDAAAGEVASAFRFARSEAIRTGETHGVSASAADQRVRVYRRDESVTPAVPDFGVLDPVDKRPYDLQFAGDPPLAGVGISSVSLAFDGVAPAGQLLFDPAGTPMFQDTTGVYMLLSAAVSLAAGGQTRVVTVAPMTGRVTIQ